MYNNGEIYGTKQVAYGKNGDIELPEDSYHANDIIDIAKKIDTFDISIRPFEDCCTIFAPKNPKTKPSMERVLEYESKWNYQSMIDEAIKNVETIYIKKEDLF